MSAAHDTHHHGHDDHHADELGGASHATFKGYMTGFVLSVILTVIPFWLVMGDVTNHKTIAAIILALGAVQMIVHIVFFLHMDTRSEGGWNMLAMIFTIVLVVITLSGSLWVMHNMNENMMPHAGHSHAAPPAVTDSDE